MYYLGYAEHYAKNRTSLCDLDQKTLFFTYPLFARQDLFVATVLSTPPSPCSPSIPPLFTLVFSLISSYHLPLDGLRLAETLSAY